MGFPSPGNYIRRRAYLFIILHPPMRLLVFTLLSCLSLVLAMEYTLPMRSIRQLSAGNMDSFTGSERFLFRREVKCVDTASYICPGTIPITQRPQFVQPSLGLICMVLIAEGNECCPQGMSCCGNGTHACAIPGGVCCGKGGCDIGERCCEGKGCCPASMRCCAGGKCCANLQATSSSTSTSTSTSKATATATGKAKGS